MPTYIALNIGEFGEIETYALMFHEDNYDISKLVNKFMEETNYSLQRKYKINIKDERIIIKNIKSTDVNLYESEFKNYLISNGFNDLFEKSTFVYFTE